MRLQNILKGGNFAVILVILFVFIAIIAFAYFQKTALLGDYRVNMFSSIGASKTITGIDTPIDANVNTEDLSIGVTGNDIPSTLGLIHTAKAEMGDSITTLSRKIAREYIDDNNLSVTKEQKIFIEDYIQNTIGDYDLQIGDEISVSEGIISEAVQKSGSLTEYQVDYYTNFVELIWDSTF